MNPLFIEIIEFYANFFETYITVEFVTKLNKPKYKGRKKHIAAIVAFLLLMANAEFFQNMPQLPDIMTYTGIAITFVYSLIAFRDKVIFRLLTSVTAIFIIVVSNLLTLMIFSLIFDVNVEKLMSQFNIYKLACFLISKILLFAVTRVIYAFRKKDISNIPFSTTVAVIIVPLLTIAVMVIITETSGNMELNDRNTFYLLLSFIGMIVINVVFYALLAKLSRDYSLQAENRLLRQRNLLQMEYVKNTHALNEEIRSIRHDMKNQITYMKEIFLRGNLNEALLHADGMIEKIDSTQKMISTDRFVFDAIVNTKLREASAKGININYKVMCSLENCIEDEDLVSLLGNVLDNAIEACENMHGNSEISLDIRKMQSYLMITVKNTICKPVLKSNPELKSTKNDISNHGIGIKNIKKIALKYSGNVMFDEKNDNFICKIMLII